MDEALKRLAQAIEKVSPVVWEAAYRQVTIETAELFAGLILMMFLAAYLNRLKLRRKAQREDDYFLCGLGAIVCLVVCVPIITQIVDNVCNPTLQAIKQLKGLL